MKTAILLISFGTSDRDARENSLERIYEELRQSRDDALLYQAYTSGMIIEKLAGEGIFMDTPKQALQKAADAGIERLYVLPTHMIPGMEYGKILSVLEKYQKHFRCVRTAPPILGEREDCKKLIPVLNEILDFREEYEYILMGHGTESRANIRYQQMQEALRESDLPQVHIASVEAEPDLEDVISQIKKRGRPKKVILHPLMVVAGDHAKNDMAGREDSYVSRLKEEGWEVETIVKGLGEYSQFRRLYLEKLEILKGLG